jgi:two-component system, NarL family, response regulator NreC
LPGPTRIILAEDRGDFRQYVRNLLDKQPGLRVVAEADDGREAIRLAHSLTPDIVVTDVVMPNVNGIEATRQIVSILPSIKVIALSIHAEEQFVNAMRDAGAVGYVLKQNAFAELPVAIRTVLVGGTYFPVGNKLS